jgi:hypothetical protein
MEIARAVSHTGCALIRRRQARRRPMFARFASPSRNRCEFL